MEAAPLSPPVLRLAVDELKVCPVCGCLNAQSNLECVICRWHGKFDHDPKKIKVQFALLIEQNPDLRAHFAEHEIAWSHKGLWARVRRWLSRRRGVDLWA